jgi:hypothetical protein
MSSFFITSRDFSSVSACCAQGGFTYVSCKYVHFYTPAYYLPKISSLLYLQVRTLQRVLNDLRWPGFLAVAWFSSSSTPSLPSLVSKLDRQHTERLRKRDKLLTGRGVGEEPNRTTRESLVLYESFKTFCYLRFFYFISYAAVSVFVRSSHHRVKKFLSLYYSFVLMH